MSSTALWQGPWIVECGLARNLENEFEALLQFQLETRHSAHPCTEPQLPDLDISGQRIDPFQKHVARRAYSRTTENTENMTQTQTGKYLSLARSYP